MTDPCPNPVFDPTPDWADAQSARQVLAGWFASLSDIPAETVLLPFMAAGFCAATFLVLRAFGKL